jgi:hypothetical protein
MTFHDLPPWMLVAVSGLLVRARRLVGLGGQTRQEPIPEPGRQPGARSAPRCGGQVSSCQRWCPPPVRTRSHATTRQDRELRLVLLCGRDGQFVGDRGHGKPHRTVGRHVTTRSPVGIKADTWLDALLGHTPRCARHSPTGVRFCDRRLEGEPARGSGAWSPGHLSLGSPRRRWHFWRVRRPLLCQRAEPGRGDLQHLLAFGC